MTRPELTSKRDLTFSGWIREKLPDSSNGYMVSDLDFILYNYKEKICMLLEIKTRNSNLKDWQRRLFANLSKWIEKGIDSDWLFGGFHVVKFENSFFHDGKCWYDDREINEQELVKILSFNTLHGHAKLI